MADHAILSPSASHRWIQCPASIRMTALTSASTVSDSVWAAEGTAAHTVAEISARYYTLRSITKAEYRAGIAAATADWPGEADNMIRHGKEYARLLKAKLREFPNSALLLEQRVNTGIEECWGTADAIIVSPAHVETVDYKYGRGYRVDAEDNPQLRLYALGAWLEFGELLGDPRIIRMSIFQPRLGHWPTWETTADELLAWRDRVALVAAQALHDDDAPFGPSEDACRWCPVAGECRPRMEAALDEDFSHDPDLLTLEEIGELLAKLPEILNWAKALQETALRKMYSEHQDIPGWKVVMSGGRRSIKDTDAALAVLHAIGFTTEQVADLKLKGIGELERLLGKQRFDEMLGSLALKGDGSPAIAREKDPREAVSSIAEARKEFGDQQ